MQSLMQHLKDNTDLSWHHDTLFSGRTNENKTTAKKAVLIANRNARKKENVLHRVLHFVQYAVYVY